MKFDLQKQDHQKLSMNYKYLLLRVFIEKKSTAPNSAKVSIATNDKPAIIAGLAEGKIILRKTFNFEKPKFLPKSIRFCD